MEKRDKNMKPQRTRKNLESTERRQSKDPQVIDI